MNQDTVSNRDPLTNTQGTWLAVPATAAEAEKIANARRKLSNYRQEAEQLAADYEALIKQSLAIFRQPEFAPLYLSDQLIESMLAEFGEPPIVEHDDDPAFSDYLRTAVLTVASSRLRRVLSEQVCRFLPEYVERGAIHEALVIEHNAYLTVMSDAATPLLVQMSVGGLARWYDQHEADEPTSE